MAELAEKISAMHAMSPRYLVIFCCLAVQFAALGVGIRRECFSPYSCDYTGDRLRRMRMTSYSTIAVTWIVLAIVHFFF